MLKRLFDILGAGVGLLALSPFMAVTAILVCWNLGWPVFFHQMRPGLRGKPFKLIKFRSMLNSDSRGLADHDRLTSFGKALRASSLDELPELWNVLRGDMSLVGPRPLLMAYLPRYTAEQSRRHDVRPGITGWAQVNGRNALTWDEKFRYDVWYVDHQSLILDLRILFLTVWNVIGRRGISADGHVSMPEFMGDGPLVNQNDDADG